MFAQMMAAASGGGGGAYSLVYSSFSASTSKSITDLVDGKDYLVIAYTGASGGVQVTRFDNSTAANGTLTKLSNMTNANYNMGGTVFNLKASGTSETITLPVNGWLLVYANG